jgi:hypothetical protein
LRKTRKKRRRMTRIQRKTLALCAADKDLKPQDRQPRVRDHKITY